MIIVHAQVRPTQNATNSQSSEMAR